MVKQRVDLTYKYNQKKGRHGWIRLTPAYSIKAVLKYLDTSSQHILDPFSGTGTTGLICAEHGIACDLMEINPFLVWLATVKTRRYSLSEITAAQKRVGDIIKGAQQNINTPAWVPPIRSIERWWTPTRLTVLARIFENIQAMKQTGPQSSIDLLLVAFCRLVIQWSNAAFNHQSMSFKDQAQPQLFEQHEPDEILASFGQIASEIIQSAHSPIAQEPRVIKGDSRQVDQQVKGPYTHVITSPPYPNRMSYIRELRPYMYWLGFLTTARQAGELDWQAIGGTWGIATSRLSEWKPGNCVIEHRGFYDLIDAIATTKARHSQTLANYVHRYFVDAAAHLTGLRNVLAPSAKIVYVVGNSKFYDVLVPVEQIYASLMKQCGFSTPEIEILRKRNSKKELYEYAVIATVT